MLEQYGPLVVSYLVRIAIALLILFFGLQIIKRVVRFTTERFAKMEMDVSLKGFLATLLDGVLKVLLVVTVISYLGIEMTSFAALIGAAGLAIGLAFQGSLANFAGGVLILILKPFTVGDFIEAAGYSGTIREIQIFYTILSTPDNRKVIIPNADLSNSSAINISANPTRRINFVFRVSYDSDITHVKDTIRTVFENHELVLPDPAPFVRVGQHGDHGLEMFGRVWVNSPNYWAVNWDLLEQVKEAFDREGIIIPFNQLSVTVNKDQVNEEN